MDNSLKNSMFQYYDERALEYDEIYLCGKGPASISNSSAYIEETNKLKTVIKKICFGKILDIPSGTAFWLPSYSDKCESVLLVDQSKAMLDESMKRAQQNGVGYCCETLNGDVFDIDLFTNKFNIILIGFFISHLTEQEEYTFISRMKSSLNNKGKILVLDSTWNQQRALTREKEGKQVRRLNNGTQFNIYKKYFDQTDIESFGSKHNLKIEVHHFGSTFCAFTGEL